MHRFVTILALAGLLVACTGQGAGDIEQPTDEPAATAPSTTPAASATASDGGASGTSVDCAEAFSALAEEDISSITELGDLPDEVEPTIESCASVEEWIAGAQQVVDEEFNPGTANLLLGILCDGEMSLSGTEICRELASS
jgi:hypothetical protein